MSRPAPPGFMRVLLLALLLSLAGACLAQANDPTPLQFANTAEETRFHQLAAELRCVMCQNQSLADSNAQIAHDLRREVLALIRQGKSDADIKQFLVDRYGPFVLYQPELSPATWPLWFGPALLVLAGGVIVLRILKRRRRDPALNHPQPDDNQEW